MMSFSSNCSKGSACTRLLSTNKSNRLPPNAWLTCRRNCPLVVSISSNKAETSEMVNISSNFQKPLSALTSDKCRRNSRPVTGFDRVFSNVPLSGDEAQSKPAKTLCKIQPTMTSPNLFAQLTFALIPLNSTTRIVVD